MKKYTKLLIILSLVLSLFACNKKAEEVVEEAKVEETYYRRIAVASIEGTVTVKHADGQELSAYEGMLLFDGDDVLVNDESSLVLDVDSDKHLFAEAKTHFILSAKGDEDSNQTKIHLEDGSVLCQIQEKLKDGESFDIETSSSTMCVRGTVFRVSMLSSEDQTDKYQMVEVYNGKVWSNIDKTNDEVTLEPGQCALIKDATEEKDAAYVRADQIDEDFWNSPDTNIQVSKEDGTGSAVLNIAYNKLSSKVVDNLVTISDSGQELSLTKEELTDLSATAVKNEEKAAAESAKKEVPVGVLNENDFRSGALNDDICAQYGHTIITVNGVRQCSICGRQFSSEYVDTDKDKANAKAAEESGMPMNIVLPEPIKKTTEVTVIVPPEDEEPTPDDGGGNGDQQEPGSGQESGGYVPVSNGGGVGTVSGNNVPASNPEENGE